ncbi:hypothetical protein ACWENQ_08460 [Nonomuraea sp. NPDC004354]
MIGWFRRKAALLAELEEAREQAIAVAAQRDQAHEQLAELIRPGSLRSQVLREKARADALAARVELLQAANMRLHQR